MCVFNLMLSCRDHLDSLYPQVALSPLTTDESLALVSDLWSLGHLSLQMPSGWLGRALAAELGLASRGPSFLHGESPFIWATKGRHLSTSTSTAWEVDVM